MPADDDAHQWLSLLAELKAQGLTSHQCGLLMVVGVLDYVTVDGEGRWALALPVAEALEVASTLQAFHLMPSAPS